MNAVGDRMHELLLEVVDKAGTWKRIEAEAPGELTREEAFAYEDLLQSILRFSDEYAGFEEVQRALALADEETT